MLLRWPRMHKTNVPPASFCLPSSWTLSVLSPRWMCELKEFWEALHLACQASTPAPPTLPKLPDPTDVFHLRLCLAANISPTKTRRGWSRDVLCHAIITTQPLAFRWLEGREEVIYWQRKAAFSRRVLIHQRAEHQVCDKHHVQCTVRRISLQNLVLPCCSFLSLSFFCGKNYFTPQQSSVRDA